MTLTLYLQADALRELDFSDDRLAVVLDRLEQDAKLGNIYAGNPKRATTKPTAEKMLRSLRGIHLNVIDFNGAKSGFVTPFRCASWRCLAFARPLSRH